MNGNYADLHSSMDSIHQRLRLRSVEAGLIQ